MNDINKLVKQHLEGGSDTTVAELAEQAGLPAGGFFGKLGNLGLGGSVRRPTLKELEAKEAAYLTRLSAAPADEASVPQEDGDGDGDFDKHVEDALRILATSAQQRPSPVYSESTVIPNNDGTPDSPGFWSTLEALGINIHRPPVSPFTFHEK